MRIRGYTEVDLAAILDIYGRSKLDELKFEDKTFTLLPLANFYSQRFKANRVLTSQAVISQLSAYINGMVSVWHTALRPPITECQSVLKQ